MDQFTPDQLQLIRDIFARDNNTNQYMRDTHEREAERDRSAGREQEAQSHDTCYQQYVEKISARAEVLRIVDEIIGAGETDG